MIVLKCLEVDERIVHITIKQSRKSPIHMGKEDYYRNINRRIRYALFMR